MNNMPTSGTLLFVVFPPAMEDEITAAARTVGDGWTILPTIWGHSHERSFHDTHVWPGHLSALVIIVPPEKVETLVEVLRSVRARGEEAGDPPPVHVYAWDVRALL